MKWKKAGCLFLTAVLGAGLLAGCGNQAETGNAGSTPTDVESKAVETGAAEAVETQTTEKKEAPHYSYRMVMHNFGPWMISRKWRSAGKRSIMRILILFMWKLQMQVTALT